MKTMQVLNPWASGLPKEAINQIKTSAELFHTRMRGYIETQHPEEMCDVTPDLEDRLKEVWFAAGCRLLALEQDHSSVSFDTWLDHVQAVLDMTFGQNKEGVGLANA